MASILGAVIGWFTGTQDPLSGFSDIPDPISGLSERDIYLIHSGWEIVRKDFRKNGCRLFEIFVGANPASKDLFSALKGVPIDKIMENKRALAHAVTTMSYLDNFVYNCPDSECAAALFKKFGRDHVNRKIYKADFEGLPPIMAIYLKELIGSLWNDDMEDSWNKFFNFMISASFDHLDE